MSSSLCRGGQGGWNELLCVWAWVGGWVGAYLLEEGLDAGVGLVEERLRDEAGKGGEGLSSSSSSSSSSSFS